MEPLFPRVREAINNITQGHRQDSALNGCNGGNRNVTPRCIASGATVCEGGFTGTENLSQQRCISNIVGLTSAAPTPSNITVTPSAAPENIAAFNGNLKTDNEAVQIEAGVKAKIVNGRIVAEISLDGALTNATSVSYKLEGDKISGKPEPTELKFHGKSHGAELQTEKSGVKFTVSPAGKYDNMTLTFIRSDGTKQEIKITRDQIRNVNGSPVAAAGAASTASSPSDRRPQTTPNATATSPQPAIVPSSPPVSSEELTVQQAAAGVVNAVNAVTKAMRFDEGISKNDIEAKLKSNINSKIEFPLANISMSQFNFAEERADVIKEAGTPLVEAIKKHIEPRQKLIVDALIESKDMSASDIRGLATDLKKAQSYWDEEAKNKKLDEIAMTIKEKPGAAVLAGLVWDVEYRGTWWNTLDFVSQLKSARGDKSSFTGEPVREQEQSALAMTAESTESPAIKSTPVVPEKVADGATSVPATPPPSSSPTTTDPVSITKQSSIAQERWKLSVELGAEMLKVSGGIENSDATNYRILEDLWANNFRAILRRQPNSQLDEILEAVAAIRAKDKSWQAKSWANATQEIEDKIDALKRLDAPGSSASPVSARSGDAAPNTSGAAGASNITEEQKKLQKSLSDYMKEFKELTGKSTLETLRQDNWRQTFSDKPNYQLEEIGRQVLELRQKLPKEQLQTSAPTIQKILDTLVALKEFDLSK